jgi:hypothetical protein
MGGAIFVMDGGSLFAGGVITLTGDTVAAGRHTGSASDGSAFGGGLFLQGSGTLRFSPGLGQTEHVSNAIDDQTGVEENGYTLPAGFTPGSYRLIKSGLGYARALSGQRLLRRHVAEAGNSRPRSNNRGRHR